jgi:signal recognition particle subunit SEC65
MTSHEPTQKGIPRYIITEPQLEAIEMVLKESGINIKRNRLLSEIRANSYPPGKIEGEMHGRILP